MENIIPSLKDFLASQTINCQNGDIVTIEKRLVAGAFSECKDEVFLDTEIERKNRNDLIAKVANVTCSNNEKEFLFFYPQMKDKFGNDYYIDLLLYRNFDVNHCCVNGSVVQRFFKFGSNKVISEDDFYKAKLVIEKLFSIYDYDINILLDFLKDSNVPIFIQWAELWYNFFNTEPIDNSNIYTRKKLF